VPPAASASCSPTTRLRLAVEHDFVNHLTADVDPVRARVKVMYAVQQRGRARVRGSDGRSGWKTRPSYGKPASRTMTRRFPAAVERPFAASMGPTNLARSSSSHVPMISHPGGDVAQPAHRDGRPERCGGLRAIDRLIHSRMPSPSIRRIGE